MLAGVMIGASLSVSGAVYQAIFVNPLVSPSLLGVLAELPSARLWAWSSPDHGLWCRSFPSPSAWCSDYSRGHSEDTQG
jgi:hypothetical protein